MAEKDFSEEGFIIAHDMFDVDFISNVYGEAMKNYHEVQIYLKKKELPFGIGQKQGYKEIVQRQMGRFEMTYHMENICDIHNSSGYRQIVAIIETLLGENYKLINQSLVLSAAHTTEQTWHQDGPHVSLLEHLPCHCLNVFIPLLDMTPELGPTELRPRSHYLTRDLKKSFLLSLARKDMSTPIAPILRRGSILAFDYRILHRGKANLSEVDRPVLVLTFAKDWFKDNLNFPSRSIFDEII